MHKIKAAIAGILALFAAATAGAQTYPTVPSGTVIGRTAVGTGPAQAIPFSTLIALMLQSSLTIPTINTNTVIYRGSTSGQATVSAQAVAGTPSIKWPTTSGTVPSTATSPILLDAVTGAISCPTCATSTSAASPIVASRALAQTLNLSSFTGLVTVGYAAAGDGGGATFKNVGSAGYFDAQPLTGTISAAGSGYANAAYTGVPLSTGQCRASANVTVAGTAVTVVTLIGLKGTGCKVGDILSTSNTNLGGAGSGFTWTVATVSSPLGSFADSVGNHWQIVPDQGNILNVRQFGAVGNYTASGGDAAATDDGPAFINSQIYASYGVGTIDAGGYVGTSILVPKGAYKICNGIIIADSGTLRGLGPANSILKQCDADAATVNFVTICNPSSLKACFGGRLVDLQLFTGSGAANSNISMIYTNSSQQNEILNNVTVYSGKRLCFWGDTGYGGAANLVINGLFCTPSSLSTNAGVQFTFGAAAITMKNWIVESGGAASINGVQITTGGVVDLEGGHCENISTCIFVNVTTGSTITRIHSQTGGANCTNLITRQAGSHTNAIVAGALTPNGCTNTINNAGAATTGNVVGDTVF